MSDRLARIKRLLRVKEQQRDRARGHLADASRAAVDSTRTLRLSIRSSFSISPAVAAASASRNASIARSSWPIELHYGAKPKTEWLVDDYYEVPFGTLVPKEGRNVIVAGRCLSAEHEALASCRVTAQCFEYGRAAAIAADMSIRDDLAFQEIDGVAVAERMNAGTFVYK